jgi:ABC-type glycerol-3-phosphate transport system substrate-binding protein
MGITRRRFLSGSVAVATGALASTRGLGNTPGAAAQSGTITLWGWDGTYEGAKSQVEAFQQKHPGVTVDIKTFDYETVHTNLLNALVAGTGAPDLCAIDVLRLTQYIDGLTDLSAHRAEYEDYFVPPILDLCSYQGKLYGLATDSEPVGLLYRKDIWDQYGIKEEDIETWADLAAAGDKLNQDSKGAVSLYSMFGNDHFLYEVLAIEQGFAGYYFDDTDTKVIVDDPKSIAAAQVIKQLWDSKGALHNPGGADIYEAETMVLLKSSKVASQIVSPAWFPFYLTGQLPEQSGKWRLMQAPAIAKGEPRVGYQYPTVYVMPNQSQQQDLAWEFEIAALTGAGARSLYDLTHILPADAGLLKELLPETDEYFGGQKTFELWNTIAHDAPKVFFGVGFTEAQAIFGTHLQQILSGEKSPEDGMHEAAAEIRQKLNKS